MTSEFTVDPSSQFKVHSWKRQRQERGQRSGTSKGMSHHRGTEGTEESVSFFLKALRGRFLKRGPLSAWPPLRAKLKKKPFFSSYFFSVPSVSLW
jgi:hypothetical protein